MKLCGRSTAFEAARCSECDLAGAAAAAAGVAVCCAGPAAVSTASPECGCCCCCCSCCCPCASSPPNVSRSRRHLRLSASAGEEVEHGALKLEASRPGRPGHPCGHPPCHPPMMRRCSLPRLSRKLAWLTGGGGLACCRAAMPATAAAEGRRDPGCEGMVEPLRLRLAAAAAAAAASCSAFRRSASSAADTDRSQSLRRGGRGGRAGALCNCYLGRVAGSPKKPCTPAPSRRLSSLPSVWAAPAALVVSFQCPQQLLASVRCGHHLKRQRRRRRRACRLVRVTAGARSCGSGGALLPPPLLRGGGGLLALRQAAQLQRHDLQEFGILHGACGRMKMRSITRGALHQAHQRPPPRPQPTHAPDPSWSTSASISCTSRAHTLSPIRWKAAPSSCSSMAPEPSASMRRKAVLRLSRCSSVSLGRAVLPRARSHLLTTHASSGAARSSDVCSGGRRVVGGGVAWWVSVGGRRRRRRWRVGGGGWAAAGPRTHPGGDGRLPGGLDAWLGRTAAWHPSHALYNTPLMAGSLALRPSAWKHASRRQQGQDEAPDRAASFLVL